ncbi:DUF1214 domain-containing protein [Gordonia amicalis]|uniref:DUF1214 domain-containing protein n=1 Tax=Gordonia amicalis TaxID=89053 RepID=UPI0002A65624|nr:DUF1214 domain-containing protein [Gordonia amicalis]NKX79506.1 DUF1214 domain-containing protein [Gordonia amicalis]GAC54587.1 hypothetical protein GOAMI_33_00500 [Gordonia amicalis NBRC 100051 = JCM 11271]
MSGDARPEVAAWNGLIDALRTAGDKLAADTADLDPAEQADGFRALVRALSNQLSRLEIDRERPELVPFNGWRHKFLMDNPDFRYWVTEVRGDRTYRIRGNRGDASYLSVTVYKRTGGIGSEATARIDSDAIGFDDDGGFEILVGGTAPGAGDWLDLPERSGAIWVRFFHDDVAHNELGWCSIEPVVEPPVPPSIDPDRFTSALGTLAATTSMLPTIFEISTKDDLDPPNTLRHWSEMAGGAVFTEPGIHYVRGGWQLQPDQALLLEGDTVECRYWNILAYSRFLNSLDFRYRPVSYTGATATVVDGRYRFVVAAEDPGVGDWIDSEGRDFGIVVMRFLQPTDTPPLPSARMVQLHELRGE